MAMSLRPLPLPALLLLLLDNCTSVRPGGASTRDYRVLEVPANSRLQQASIQPRATPEVIGVCAAPCCVP
jgi:hypothetical protein